MSTTMDQAANETKRAGGRVTDDVESIKSSFSQLRHDVLELLGSAFGLGKSGAEYAKDSAGDAVEAMKLRLTDLKERGADRMHAVEKKIEENPLPAALIAFGVGFLIAKILTRR